MCEPQTWEAHRWGWQGRRASAPSTTAPRSSEWAWRSSVDESTSVLKLQHDTSLIRFIQTEIFSHAKKTKSVNVQNKSPVAGRSSWCRCNSIGTYVGHKNCHLSNFWAQMCRHFKTVLFVHLLSSSEQQMMLGSSLKPDPSSHFWSPDFLRGTKGLQCYYLT